MWKSLIDTPPNTRPPAFAKSLEKQGRSKSNQKNILYSP